MAKVGLFFGSFNPIHIGHLAIGNYIVEYTDIEQVWFVVSPHNPLKKKESLLSDHHRLAMVRLAVEYDNRFKASNVEFDMPQPSYTIDTLIYLKEKHTDHDFSIIMGADQLPFFHKWKNHEQLQLMAQRIVYPRPGFVIDEKLHHENIIFVEAPMMDISSTFIRESIKSGRELRHFVHHKVWEYMDEMHFYRK